MTTTNRIISIETQRARTASHEVIFAVRTRDEAAADDERWTVQTVLKAMDRAERFYSQAPNGRRARVQRYTCAGCHQEHIRTHISDAAIHDLTMLPHTDGSPVATSAAGARGSRTLATTPARHRNRLKVAPTNASPSKAGRAGWQVDAPVPHPSLFVHPRSPVLLLAARRPSPPPSTARRCFDLIHVPGDC